MNAATHTNSTATNPVLANPCAKINLSLEILGRRPDGFHELRSLAIGIDLRDRIRVSRTETAGVSIVCDVAALSDPSNLAARAAELIRSRFDVPGGIQVELTKSIPIASGLGGGSADAAAVLALCNEHFALGMRRDELAALGAEIGSDVPLYFSMPCALVSGRGEIVRPAALRWSGWVLLVITGEHVSTAEVYGELNSSEHSDAPWNDLSALLNAESAAELNAILTNQLEPAVFRVAPVVASMFEELHLRGHGPFRVSGAGSVMYKLFDEETAAQEAADKVAKECTHVTTMVVAAPTSFTPLTKERRRT